MQDILLGYLSVREHLTLRRVCKGTMDWVQRPPWSQNELERWQCYTPKVTGDSPYGLKYAASMKIPVTKFQVTINQKEPKELVYKFLAIYGPSIKTLHFTRNEENSDIELTVKGSGNSCACTRKKLCFKCNDKVSIIDVLLLDKIRFPFVFQKLNELKLDFVLKNREEARVIIKMLEKCTSLKSLKLPLFDLEEVNPDFVGTPYIVIEEFLNPVILYVQRRGRHNLKTLDMEAWKNSDLLDHGMICNRLVDLLTEGSVFGVRFVNVLADIIERSLFSRPDWQYLTDHNRPEIRPYQAVQSLMNPGPKLLTFLKFPHLEELSVGCSDYQSYTVPDDLPERVGWPNLKSINIDTTPPVQTGVVSFRIGDNVVLGVPGEGRKNAWAKTLNIITGFDGTRRQTVRKISINEKSARYFDGSYHTCGLEFPAPSLAAFFPDVTVLQIERWDSPEDESFLLIWRTLLKLSSLKIKNCLKLTDYGFIGKRENNPTFHKLKRKFGLISCSNFSSLLESPHTLTYF